MKRWFFQFIVMSLLLSGNLFASQVIDRMFFAGAGFSYNDRLGNFYFSNGSQQEVARSEIPTIGLIAGKRFALPWLIRLHVPLCLDYGFKHEKTDDSYDASNYKSFDGVKKSTLFEASLIPALQLPLRMSSDAAFYLSVGGGFHLVRFTEINIDDFMNSFTCSSVSFSGGAGFEKMIDKNRAFTLQYSLRYGKPVYYKYMKDLFPFSGITYKETFFTHSIQFLIMVYKGYRR